MNKQKHCTSLPLRSLVSYYYLLLDFGISKFDLQQKNPQWRSIIWRPIGAANSSAQTCRLGLWVPSPIGLAYRRPGPLHVACSMQAHSTQPKMCRPPCGPLRGPKYAFVRDVGFSIGASACGF